MAILQPFFKSDVTAVSPKKRANSPRRNSGAGGCEACGLYKHCHSPKMTATGDGRKGILIIAEAPGASEDAKGEQLIGKSGQRLRKELKRVGIDLDVDCRKINAVACRPKDNKTPTDNEVACCRHRVMAEIQEFRPTVILALGGPAMKSLAQHRASWDHGFPAIGLWEGEVIPDQEIGAWIVPTWHPAFMLRLDGHPVYERKWRQDLQAVADLAAQGEAPIKEDFASYVEVLISPDAAARRLAALYSELMTRKNPKVVFDYETTGRKPYVEGHRIVSCAFCYDDNKAVSFLMNDRTWPWVERILRHPKIAKKAHNMKFEELWTRVRGNPTKGGFEVKNWAWDSMLGSFLLDNRVGKSGLKLQGYLKQGVIGYDTSIAHFLKSSSKDSNALNNIDQAPVRDLLLYGGMDVLLTWRLCEHQEPLINADAGLVEAYDLWHQAAITFVDTEINGIVTDRDYCERQAKHLDKRIAHLRKRVLTYPEVVKWQQMFGDKFNLNSKQQLGQLLFGPNGLGFDAKKLTTAGNASVDKEVLEDLQLSFAKDMVQINKLQKLQGTYLRGFLSEAPDGIMHPFYNLNTVVSFRGSCVAKGTKIMINRGYPDKVGVPIEQVQAGDFAFCFDDQLRPILRKVLWAGKTGHKQVLRVHWRAARGQVGFVDLTPEHKIRMADGEYVMAKDVMQYSCILPITEKRPSGIAIRSAMAMRRSRREGNGGDLLYTTRNAPVQEHVLVYEQRTGVSCSGKDVHHKDLNHDNHEFNNLCLMTRAAHTRLHTLKLLEDPKRRQKNREHLVRQQKKIKYVSGPQNAKSFNLSRLTCLRAMVAARGRIKRIPIDTATFRKYAAEHKLDLHNIKMRYANSGRFLSRGLIKGMLLAHGIHETKVLLGIGHERLMGLVDFYRLWDLPLAFNNHVITSVEALEDPVDVYDLTVEGAHNFIANEICVHNCDSPSFQNIPKRDKESQLITRNALFARDGYLWLEIDYASIEVRIAATYHKDPNMLRYLNDEHSDMHRDMAMQLMFLDEEQVSKYLRNAAKNGFVFAQFYGDWYQACATNMWLKWFNSDSARLKNGTHIYDHLRSKGIKSLEQFIKHVERVENHFWNKRFPVYGEWREDNWEEYRRKGYMRGHTGFIYNAIMDRKQTSNYGTQGSGFHCLVRSMIEANNKLKREQWKSFVNGQIHDAMEINAHADEINDLLPAMRKIMVDDLMARYSWINCPMDVEFELAPLGQSWANLKQVHHRDKVCDCGLEWGYKDKRDDGKVRWDCPVCSHFDVI